MHYLYSQKDFELAQKFADAVLSMDRIYRERANNTESFFAKEGLVPVIITDLDYNYIENWVEIKLLLRWIYNEYKSIENDARKNYMFEQISSVISLGEWVFENKKFTYRQLVSDLLFVNPNPITNRQIEKKIDKLNNMLSDKNYKGDFENKLSLWKKDNIVAPKELQNALDDLVKVLKEKTLNIGIYEIDNLDVKFVIEHDRPYSGYCDFPGKTVYINADMEYVYQDLKHLVSHETHPGHMTHMQIRKTLVEQGKVPVDAALVITNTASSGVFEGLADNGLNFIGWSENKDDEIARTHRNLNSMLSITMAHMIHEEGYNIEVVKRYYKETLFVTDAAVDSKIRFLTNSFRRPFIYSYWRGNEAIKNIYSQIPKSESSEFIRFVYNNMQSINTANQFL